MKKTIMFLVTTILIMISLILSSLNVHALGGAGNNGTAYVGTEEGLQYLWHFDQGNTSSVFNNSNLLWAGVSVDPTNTPYNYTDIFTGTINGSLGCNVSGANGNANLRLENRTNFGGLEGTSATIEISFRLDRPFNSTGCDAGNDIGIVGTRAFGEGNGGALGVYLRCGGNPSNNDGTSPNGALVFKVFNAGAYSWGHTNGTTGAQGWKPNIYYNVSLIFNGSRPTWIVNGVENLTDTNGYSGPVDLTRIRFCNFGAETIPDTGNNVTLDEIAIFNRAKTWREYISTVPVVAVDNGTNNVTLRFPTNATTNTTSKVINFTYNVSASSTVLGCELWNNETSWGTKTGNQTRIDNNLTNWINYTFATDSTYLWNVLCNVSDGNLNFSIKNFSITINTLNNGTNNVTLKIPNNATWNNTRNINFTFNASASADILLCEIWTNETSWGTKTGNQTRITNNVTNWINNSFNSDGNYLWNVLCNTSDGNLNFSVKNYTLYVDATIPKINYTTPININRSFLNRNWVFVNVSTTELNIHTYRIHFDATNYTTPDVTLGSNGDTTQFFYRNFTALSDGNHSFYGWVNDSVSGNNQTENRTVTVDTTIPKVNFTNPTDANGTYSNRNWTLVNITITEVNVDTYRIHFDGANYTTPDVTIISNGDSTQSFYRNFTNLGSGNHSFYGWANDSSGWSNQTNNQTTLLNQPPIITINFPPNLYALNRNITFNYSITDADGDSLNCSLMFNSTPQSTNASVKQGLSYNITSAIDNNVNADFLATINCTDRINSTNSSSLTVRIDTVNPVITFTMPDTSNKTGNSSNITLDLSCTDNNLYNWEVNITNSSRTETIYRRLYDQINTTSQSISGVRVNFTYENDYQVIGACSDDHTNKITEDYNISKDLADLKLTFITTEKVRGRQNNIGIKLKSADLNLTDFGAVKNPSNDSYSFFFKFNGVDNGSVRKFTFKLSANETIIYRANSSFQSHFVTGNNFAVFQLANGVNSVQQISFNPQGKNEVEVDIWTSKILLNFTE